MEDKTIDMALIIAGYCAIICIKEDKETAFDCPDMLEKYKKAANEYQIPYDEYGYIDTEMVYEELDGIAKNICSEIN